MELSFNLLLVFIPIIYHSELITSGYHFRRMKIIYFILFLCFQVFLSFGQVREMQVVKGRILSSGSGEPISYATIQISENGINTMSLQAIYVHADHATGQ